MPDDEDLDPDTILDDDVDVDLDESLPSSRSQIAYGREPGFTVSDETRAKMSVAQNKQAQERYAGQLASIELSNRVAEKLAPLTAPQNRGVLLETALTKLAVDVLAGNVKPRNLREATSAMESIAKVMQMTGLEEAGAKMDKDARSELYVEIRAHLQESSGSSEMESSTKQAMDVIDASYTEDDD